MKPTVVKHTKKKAKAGKFVAAKAGQNKAFGRKIDKLPHGSAARNRMAGL